jgi:hypothetical protein
MIEHTSGGDKPRGSTLTQDDANRFDYLSADSCVPTTAPDSSNTRMIAAWEREQNLA